MTNAIQAKRKTPAQVREGLVGPVNSLPTTFNKDGSIDFDGITNMIEVGIAGGSRVVMLTAGDSQLLFMSNEEVRQLTRHVVEQTRGRALVIAATGRWWTGEVVEFAHFAREIGADVLMSLPSDQARDYTAIEKHYRAIAKVMPTMLVGVIPQSMLHAVADERAICCFKEDGSMEYAIQTIQQHHPRLKIVTGGILWRHLAQAPYGVDCYMDWMCALAPAISAQYWAACQKKDFIAMARIVREVETPLQAISGQDFYGDNSAPGARSLPGGWQALWRAALHLAGLTQPWLRAPLNMPTEAQIKVLRPEMKRIGLLK